MVAITSVSLQVFRKRTHRKCSSTIPKPQPQHTRIAPLTSKPSTQRNGHAQNPKISRFLSTFRTSSLRSLVPTRQRGLHVAPEASRRRIIVVSRLHFGAFDLPSFSTQLNLSSIAAAPSPEFALPEAHDEQDVSAEATSDLPAQQDTTSTAEYTAEIEGPETAHSFISSDAEGTPSNTTVQSTSSLCSWVEVGSTLGAVRAALFSSSHSSPILDCSEGFSPIVDDWSADVGPEPVECGYDDPEWHAAEATTSSINEDSFLRMAESDLGW